MLSFYESSSVFSGTHHNKHSGHSKAKTALPSSGPPLFAGSGRHHSPLSRLVLEDAVRQGNVHAVRNCLRGADPNQSNPYTGKTPLMLAVENGKERIACLLLDRGAQVDRQDHELRTALMLAAKAGNVKSVELLLQHRVRIDKVDRNGMNALHLAVNHNHWPVAKLLLEKGQSIESTDYLGRTPLMIAAEKGHLQLLKTLLEKNARLETSNFDRMNALLLAAREGHPNIVETLLAKGANPHHQNRYGMSALMMAAHTGDTASAGMLLKSGARTELRNIHGETALTLASASGHADVVRQLLRYGADPGRALPNGNTPLFEAVRFERPAVVSALLEKPELAAINATGDKGQTALIQAVKNGNLPIVSRLLATPGLLPDKRDQDGNTALCWAVLRRQPRIMKLLLAHGANLNIANNKGDTPLHLASATGIPDLTRQLLNTVPAPSHLRNQAGKTPLLVALEHDHTHTMDMLLQAMRDQAPEEYDAELQSFRKALKAKANQLGMSELAQKDPADFHTVLPVLVKHQQARLAEQFFLAGGKPLSGLWRPLYEEMQAIIHSPQKERRDQAWRAIALLIPGRLNLQGKPDSEGKSHSAASSSILEPTIVAFAKAMQIRFAKDDDASASSNG